MDSCFRCRIRKLSCSLKTPACKQCGLAGIECTYDRVLWSEPTAQSQRRPEFAIAMADSNHRIDEDEASDTDTIDSLDQCRQPPLRHLDGDLVYTSIERPAKQKRIHGALDSSSPFVPSRPDVGDRDSYEFSINDQIVQYLFEPTDQLLPTLESSKASWQFTIGTKICGMLIDVPFGKLVVSTIGAPFLDNQYAGDELDFLEVSWQKSFLVARRINPWQRGETADMRTVLREHIEGLVAGRCEQMPRAQEVRRSGNPGSILFDSDLGKLRNSPLPQPRQINLKPSLSPPPMVPLPAIRSHSSSPPGPSQGDAVLVSSMDNGKVTDISRQAGLQMLASDAEADPMWSRRPKGVLKNESRKELTKKLRKDLREELRKMLRKKLRKKLRKELRKELREELRKDLKNELRKVSRD